MTALQKTRILVVGIGNPYRGDDAAGLLVARKLRALAPAGVEILEQGGEAAALMDCWGGAGEVILADAAVSGAPPGTVHRWDVSAQPLPSRTWVRSTHDFGVFEAIELARTLNRLPRRLTVYGLEGSDFQPGEKLSPETARAAEEAVDAILRQIRERDREEGKPCTNIP